MNKKIIAAALLTIAAAGAQAQVYVGATVGASSYNLDCSGADQCDTKDSAFKVLAGYQITPMFAMEASYFDLGKATGREDGINVKGGATGIDVAAVLRMPLSPEVNVFAKLGVASVDGKVTGTYEGKSATFKHSSTQPVFGVGATYNITPTLRLRAEVETRRAKIIADGDSIKVTNYSIGIDNSF